LLRISVGFSARDAGETALRAVLNATNPATGQPYGDVNASGVLDLGDATAILGFVGGTPATSRSTQLLEAIAASPDVALILLYGWIDSNTAGDAVIKGSGATTVSRAGNQFTIQSTNTVTALSARNTDETFVTGNVSFVGAGNATVTRSGNAFTITATGDTLPQALATTSAVQFGSLRIGATGTTPAAGEIRVTGNITAYDTSDIRLKENIQLIPNALGKLEQIRGVMFDWTAEEIARRGGEDPYFVRKHDVGVIAQEVEIVLPEIVGTRDDGMKAVQYEKLTALLIESVKELSAKVTSLEQELNVLKGNK